MFGIDLNEVIRVVQIWGIPMIFAITLHEVAHGWAAKQLGDPTAFKEGRLSLNPLKHVDPMGTIVVPLAMLILTQGRVSFGWAKPVPVVFQNLRNPRRDMILVAAAGPGANLVMAAFWTALDVAARTAGVESNTWLIYVCEAGIFFNCLLMVFNFLPIPPLDGGRVLVGLLPPRAGEALSRVEPFGIIIVILLILPPFYALWNVWLEPLMRPFLDFFHRTIIRGLT